MVNGSFHKSYVFYIVDVLASRNIHTTQTHCTN